MTQFIELTRSNGYKFLLNVKKILYIQQTKKGCYITILNERSKFTMYAKESFEEIKQKLKWMLVEEEKEI